MKRKKEKKKKKKKEKKTMMILLTYRRTDRENERLKKGGRVSQDYAVEEYFCFSLTPSPVPRGLLQYLHSLLLYTTPTTTTTTTLPTTTTTTPTIYYNYYSYYRIILILILQLRSSSTKIDSGKQHCFHNLTTILLLLLHHTKEDSLYRKAPACSMRPRLTQIHHVRYLLSQFLFIFVLETKLYISLTMPMFSHALVDCVSYHKPCPPLR
jgi:hypothetical protein